MVFCWAIASKSRLVGIRLAIVPQGPGDLLGELVVQAVDQVADVVFDVADVQVLPPPVTGKENVHQVRQDMDDGIPAWQRPMPEVMDVAALGIGGDQRLGDLRQSFLQANVGGHVSGSLRGGSVLNEF